MKAIKAGVRAAFILPAFLGLALSAGCSMTPSEPVFIEKVYPDPPNEPRFYSEAPIFSSADIVGETEDQRMARLLAGIQRAGTGFAKPFGIAVHQGRLFMSDPQARVVFVMDRKTGLFREIGTSSPGELLKPYDIDTDNQGNLYVMDATAKDAVVYDRDGNFIRRIGDPEMFSMASHLAVNPEGTRLYIVDTGGVRSEKHHVLVFDVATGEHLFTFGHRGKDDMGFNIPKDILYGNDNKLYIVDSGNFRIKIHAAEDGAYLGSFGSIGRRAGQFARPKGIAQDPDGNIYVSDAAFGNFQIFNPEGQLLLAVGERSQANLAGRYMLPAGITVDEDGRVLMVDQFFRRLDTFRPARLERHQGYLGKKEQPKK